MTTPLKKKKPGTRSTFSHLLWSHTTHTWRNYYNFFFFLIFYSSPFPNWSYQKIRGANQTGEVPANYRCYKCHNQGHWIKNCPLNLIGEAGSDVKRNTGIPRSFIDGQNETIVQPTTAPIAEKKHEIPEELLCSICKDLYADAVMIPCCGSSFCDECKYITSYGIFEFSSVRYMWPFS